MKFCPQCGSLMLVRNVEGRIIWHCTSCGYREETSNSKESIVLKQRIQHSAKERIVVVEQKVEVLPKTRAVCPKCGHGEAYYWVVQTRRADEPPTRFFKCVKCGHVWREYD
ncbi:MAG TPA: transcription factor S [Pyrodictium sp.]|nr:transcription factor S [Pyrodictium sp.]